MYVYVYCNNIEIRDISSSAVSREYNVYARKMRKENEVMKKIVSVLLCMVMALSLCTVAFATEAEHDCYDHQDKATYVDNGDGTHTWTCGICKKAMGDPVKHTYQYSEDMEYVGEADGVKCICKAEKPAACDHVGVQETVDNKDGKTHSVICPKCKEVLNDKVEHVYAEDTGKCACGAEKPACDHVGVQKVVDNKDGKTHSVICPKCNEVLNDKAEHVYAEDTGKCACGAVKPADCKHEGSQKLVANKDGKTHNAYCPECGELMSEKIPHTYQYNSKGEFVGKGGNYCLCGAKKPTSHGNGNSNSTSNTTTNTTVTKSPKTGDMGVVLYAATALLSLSGTAVVINKRKNDK